MYGKSFDLFGKIWLFGLFQNEYSRKHKRLWFSRFDTVLRFVERICEMSGWKWRSNISNVTGTLLFFQCNLFRHLFAHAGVNFNETKSQTFEYGFDRSLRMFRKMHHPHGYYSSSVQYTRFASHHNVFGNSIEMIAKNMFS